MRKTKRKILSGAMALAMAASVLSWAPVQAYAEEAPAVVTATEETQAEETPAPEVTAEPTAEPEATAEPEVTALPTETPPF